MSSSIVDNSDVPIFFLPDELLSEIFTYITYIPTKMKLEQVCGRFRFVTFQPKSWKGIHKLQFVINCTCTAFSFGEEGVLVLAVEYIQFIL